MARTSAITKRVVHNRLAPTRVALCERHHIKDTGTSTLKFICCIGQENRSKPHAPRRQRSWHKFRYEFRWKT